MKMFLKNYFFPQFGSLS